MQPDRAPAAPHTILPDAQLVYRIAALSDKNALSDLHARHGMTLYAVAYSLVFDAEAADSTVTETFREVWRSAASFDARAGSVLRWLADLTRRAVSRRFTRRLPAGRAAPARRDDATLDPAAA